MYVFFLTIHIKFAYSTYRIALRYLMLNNALRNSKSYRKCNNKIYMCPLWNEIPIHKFRASFHLVIFFFFLHCQYENSHYGKAMNQWIAHWWVSIWNDLIWWQTMTMVGFDETILLLNEIYPLLRVRLCVFKIIYSKTVSYFIQRAYCGWDYKSICRRSWTAWKGDG